jgi:hypothetical protein
MTATSVEELFAELRYVDWHDATLDKIVLQGGDAVLVFSSLVCFAGTGEWVDMHGVEAMLTCRGVSRILQDGLVSKSAVVYEILFLDEERDDPGWRRLVKGVETGRLRIVWNSGATMEIAMTSAVLSLTSLKPNPIRRAAEGLNLPE